MFIFFHFFIVSNTYTFVLCVWKLYSWSYSVCILLSFFLKVCLWASFKLVHVTFFHPSIHSFIHSHHYTKNDHEILIYSFIDIHLDRCLLLTIMNNAGSGATKRSRKLEPTTTAGVWATADMMLKRTVSRQKGEKKWSRLHSFSHLQSSLALPLAKPNKKQDDQW